MARYDHLPIFQSTYRLTLDVYVSTHRFPREYKYTLGQKIKETASGILDAIVVANTRKDKTEMLEHARMALECCRIHMRIAYDLHIISVKGYESFARSFDEVSRQLSGWEKWSADVKRG